MTFPGRISRIKFALNVINSFTFLLQHQVCIENRLPVSARDRNQPRKGGKIDPTSKNMAKSEREKTLFF